MPDKEFKAGVYDVMVDGNSITLQSHDVFRTAVETTAERSTDERWQQWSDKPRRLEACRPHGSMLLMNFVTAEFAGPGRTRQAAPVSPIGLREGEYFAHETAALYDPELGVVLLESGMGGMGPGAIKAYFRFFHPNCNVNLCRRVDPEATAKARSFQVFRQLHLRVAIGPVSEYERRLGTGVLQTLGDDYKAQVIDIVLKCRRAKDGTLDDGRLRAMMDVVTGDGGGNIYERVQVQGRAEEDERLELIDLISQPLKSARNLPIDPMSRQISHKDKWDALINMHAEFTQ